MRRGRKLDQGLQAPHKSRSLELSPLHSQPIQATLARCCLLAYGRIEEETNRKRSAQDATRHLAAFSHQDWRQGQGAADEDPPASGLWASRTTFMECSFSGLRRCL